MTTYPVKNQHRDTNSFHLLLFILVFFTFSITGAIAANQFSSFVSLPSSPVIYESVCETLQCNLLIIHVDNLQDEQNPKLISVWAMFLNTSDHPALMFTSIFPDENYTQEQKSIANSKILTPDGKLTQNFSNTLNAYDLTFHGYIIVDQTSIENITYWITGQNSNTHYNIKPDSDLARKTILLKEHSILNNICQSIQSQNMANKSPAWQTIVPNHLVTDLENAQLYQFWNTLSDPQNKLIACEVISQ